MAVTKKLTQNGWKNVDAHLRANGWSGQGKARHLVLINNSATAAYVHLTGDGTTQPGTTTDGLPFTTDTATAPSATIQLDDIDLKTVWVYTAGSIAINYALW